MREHDLFKAINTYFDAIYFCDTDLLEKVFHSSASLFDVDNQKLFVEPIHSFKQDVATRTSPGSAKQAREHEIIMIDWLSPKCANVKIRIRAHNNVFVDHLSFVHDADGWCIVAKVWHLEKVLKTE